MPEAGNIVHGAISGAGAGFRVGGPYGAIAGAIIGGALGAAIKTPKLQVDPLRLQGAEQGQYQFLTQGEHLGEVSKTLAHANALGNAEYQKDAAQFAPNLMGNIHQNVANTTAMLGGNLTGGVQAALGKPGASARDLGLTSAQLQQQGAQGLGNELYTATGLNPYNETSSDTLISPAALLKRMDQRDVYNNQIHNQDRMAKFANAASNDWAQQAMGMLDSMSPTGGVGAGIGGAINSGTGASGQNYQAGDPSGSTSYGTDTVNPFAVQPYEGVYG